MVMVYIKQLDKECYMDGWMQSNLDDLRKAVALDWDGVLLYTGDEGDGKSTKCSQDLAYLDPTFNVERVCGTLQQIKALVPTLKPGMAIQYDESRKDINTADNVATQREFIRLMTENRDKRLYWGIVSATYFDLKKYFAIHRTRVLINVYSNKLERGFFSFYDREKKKELYIKGRKEWNWQVVQPTFRGRFGKWLPYDEEAYKARKRSFTIGKEAETVELLDDPVVKTALHKKVMAFIDWSEKNQWAKYKMGFYTAAAKYFGVSTDTLLKYRQLNHFDTDSEPIGGGLLGVPAVDAPRDTNYVLTETQVTQKEEKKAVWNDFDEKEDV